MLRVILLVVAAGTIFGQTPPAKPAAAPPPPAQEAPPEVDEALRARVNQFYQFEVEGKFNQALQMVAEDTKDLFVGSSKPSYQSFQIYSVRYSRNFAEAEVITLVNRLLPVQGFMGHPLATKTLSRWKLEGGQWCYYVDPQRDLPTTPFGPFGAANMPRPAGVPSMPLPAGLPPGMPLPAGGAPGSPSPPPLPTNLPNPHSLFADKQSVQLKSSGPSTDQVTISNPSPWPATLNFIDPRVAGLTVKLDRLALNTGQKAILSIQSSGAFPLPKTPVVLNVTVRQTNQNIPIKVTFAN